MSGVETRVFRGVGIWARDGAERREGRQRVVKEKTTRGGEREGGG